MNSLNNLTATFASIMYGGDNVGFVGDFFVLHNRWGEKKELDTAIYATAKKQSLPRQYLKA